MTAHKSFKQIFNSFFWIELEQIIEIWFLSKQSIKTNTWRWPSGIVVEYSTHNPKIEGLNPGTGTEKENRGGKPVDSKI